MEVSKDGGTPIAGWFIIEKTYRDSVIQYCQRKISTNRKTLQDYWTTSGLTKSIALRVPQWSVLILFKALPKFRVASSDSFSRGGTLRTAAFHWDWVMEVINPPNITTQYEKTLGNGLVEGQTSDWDDRFDPIGLSTVFFFWNMLGWCWMENPHICTYKLMISDLPGEMTRGYPCWFPEDSTCALLSCNGLASRDWTKHSLLANNALIIYNYAGGWFNASTSSIRCAQSNKKTCHASTPSLLVGGWAPFPETEPRARLSSRCCGMGTNTKTELFRCSCPKVWKNRSSSPNVWAQWDHHHRHHHLHLHSSSSYVQ